MPGRCASARGAGWPGGCCWSATPPGYVDALTGEGIALGLAQARAAVDAVAAGRPDRYERAWRRLGWRHDLLTKGLLAAARHPALRGRVVPAAAALPWVFGAAVNQLARPA